MLNEICGKFCWEAVSMSTLQNIFFQTTGQSSWKSTYNVLQSRTTKPGHMYFESWKTAKNMIDEWNTFFLP